MFIELNTSNLLIREWLNGSLFPLSAFLTWVILVFINDTRLEIGPGWSKTDGIPTACALSWIFFCETIRAGGVWIILRTQNDGYLVPLYVQWTINAAFIFSATAMVVTILRCTYLFSPPRWGHRYWVASAITTLAFLLLSHFTPTLTF